MRVSTGCAFPRGGHSTYRQGRGSRWSVRAHGCARSSRSTAASTRAGAWIAHHRRNGASGRRRRPCAARGRSHRVGHAHRTAGSPRLSIKPPHADFAAAAFGSDALSVRVIVEPGYEPLWERTWTVGHDGNRMGCRLQGESVPHDSGNVRSRAVFPGVVQLPPGGEPIVLLSDAQTTGGYPVAGTVIEADLWIFGQARAGNRVRLVPCSLEDAQAASDRVSAYVAAIDAAIVRGAGV